MTNRIADVSGGELRRLAAFPQVSRTFDMKTVLLADRDLGFLFWLGAALARMGYRALPAPSSQDVMEWVKQLQIPVHVLIVACSMPDAGALVHSLRRYRPQLKIIALMDGAGDPWASVPEANLYCRRPQPGEASEAQWLETIQDVSAG